MNITGIVTCVGMADVLTQTLPTWRDGLDEVVVVTTTHDEATLSVAKANDIHLAILRSVAFWQDGATFNKAAALDDALRVLNLRQHSADWLHFFDADVAPPPGWRKTIEPLIQPGNLYGAKRKQHDGSQIWDGEIAGFFQLFHASDPVAQDRPLFGSWANCSGYDSQFEQRWPKERRIILPLELTHYGKPGENWCGIGNADGMAKMREERRRRGGYLHEKLG